MTPGTLSTPPADPLASAVADSRPAAAGEPFGIWGRAFRPFFLAAGLHGALVVPYWTLAWLGVLPVPGWLSPIWWHGHELTFGFVAAAIAGFLLTATPVWSGGPALTGAPLATLVALFAGGRLALAAAGALPVWLVAALDVAFLPLVGLSLARTLYGSGQLRNYAVAAVVFVLALANAAMHAEALGLVAGIAGPALRFAVDAVVVLLLVIGGRITPAFTRNALSQRGIARDVRARPWAGALAIGAAAALALTTAIAGRGAATGVLAAVAGLSAAARMAGWQTRHTRSDPLLWSLHAGALWLCAGLLLVAAADLGAAVPASAGLHALTAGAMGTSIMAVMTRVALGHTGRALVLPRAAVGCYVLVHAAAAARVAAPFFAATGQRALLLASGLAWAGAFALFLACFTPILIRPRPDGRPG